MNTIIEETHLIKERSVDSPLDVVRRMLARGELGSLPIILGLIFLWLIFQIANPNFLTPLNLTNLMLQITALGTVSAGLILVLLLGEIDLSVGYVSGMCAAIMAVLNVKSGVPGPLAVLAGLLAGTAIGMLHGLWITKFRVPSFIVTLAGFLVWQGALLAVLGNTGTVNLRDRFILSLAGTFYPPVVGWIVGIGFVAIYIAGSIWERRRRDAAGLHVSSRRAMLARILIMAAGVMLTITLLNADRGLPSAVVFFIGVIISFDFIIRRTIFGAHVFAVGSHAEAARRAGIDVDRVRVTIFALCSTLAALGGILAASRLLAVNQSSGGGDFLLNAIAAAVIGGTSLFGGRGSLWSALLGAVVIGSISNGMDLVALPSPLKFMITGGVLLLAITVDALARRRQTGGNTPSLLK